MLASIDLKRLIPGAVLLLAVLISGALLLGRKDLPAVPTGSWGLSFREPNRPPVADASPERLAAYDAKYIGDTEKSTVYLTFDCGYENGNTGTILEILKKHNAPAAFFVVGNFLTSEPELIRQMVREGHTVGNHTWSHPDMSEITDPEAFARELDQVQDSFRKITGQEMPHYYRPPQGIYSQENLSMAKGLGYRTVFWSLAYVDWKQDQQPSEQEAVEKLTTRIHPGAVILLHNTSKTNAAVLDRVLTAWEAEGYRFGTLDELFAD